MYLDHMPSCHSQERNQRSDTDEQVDSCEDLAGRGHRVDIAVTHSGQCDNRELEAIHPSEALNTSVEDSASDDQTHGKDPETTRLRVGSETTDDPGETPEDGDQTQHSAYCPLYSGGRFSMKALIASPRSSE